MPLESSRDQGINFALGDRKSHSRFDPGVLLPECDCYALGDRKQSPLRTRLRYLFPLWSVLARENLLHNADNLICVVVEPYGFAQNIRIAGKTPLP